ncbi:phage holin family protein [Aureimonas leprariae]|uniref:Phage holin family protein n=1 Tax=Plantimonas leprariae TaxID=2615207 RepID=A0A7V7PPD9_9HYPH|nr:phage holin family protein [Aureimonas leprariae]KAB0679871.1 phage holin family protein [Aureimonas leprariae]
MPFALITRLLTGEAGLYFTRLRNMAVWYSVAGVFGLVMAIFLLVALFSWVASHLGTVGTALIFAAVFLVLAIVAVVIARISGRPPRPEKEDRLQRDILSIAGVTAMSNAPQLMRLARQKRGLIMIPAAAAGFFGLYKAIAAFRDR